MSTPTGPTSKGSRNPHRRPKKTTLPPSHVHPPQSDPDNSDSNVALTTPTPSPPRSSNAGDNIEDRNNGAEIGASQKKRNRNTKKPRDPTNTSSPMPNGTTNHRHVSSQSSLLSPDRAQATPMKPAYAGPTFHASPAPSALPIPSFFSKSVPEVSTISSVNEESEQKEMDLGADTPSKSTVSTKTGNQERDPSPLDFLFKAAREARAGSRSDSLGSQSGKVSPPETELRNHSRHPTDGSLIDIFPLEMDGSTIPSMPIGPSFATPYKERMNALRSASSPSNPSKQDLDEEQRKAKTEALKRLLLNPQPQRPASASPRLRDNSNPFDSRTPTPTNTLHNTSRSRHTSGPSTPVPFTGAQNTTKGFHTAYGNFTFLQHLSPTSNGSSKPRPPSSSLRQEVTPLSPTTRAELPSGAIETLRAESAQLQGLNQRMDRHSNSSPATKLHSSSSIDTGVVSRPLASPKAVDTKRMEDDLRRILKLDLAAGMAANGVSTGLA